jgi:hypothetical protein
MCEIKEPGAELTQGASLLHRFVRYPAMEPVRTFRPLRNQRELVASISLIQ